MKRRRLIEVVIAGVVCAGVLVLVLKLRPTEASTPAPRSEVANPSKLRLPEEADAQNPVKVKEAKRTALARDLSVVGSVAFDPDHYAVVGPLISGRVVSLRAGIGDAVRRGQVLAEIESAEVGQAEAAYLTARARWNAANANLKRENNLASLHVSAERDREVAEAQSLSERAEMDAASQRLQALGFSLAEVERLSAAKRVGRVAIRASIDGTVIAREVTMGQAVQAATDAFKLADLLRLWVNLDVYEKDLANVGADQKVEIRPSGSGGRVYPGRVAYVEPQIDEKTRTARVRIEIKNDDRSLRAGQFVTARLLGDQGQARREVIAIPRKAVSSVEGATLVFVRRDDGTFERRNVEVGASGGDLVEVAAGLREGERVATDGAFLLKSELLR